MQSQRVAFMLGGSLNRNGESIRNVVRFNAPPGALTHSFRWEPEKVLFRTVRGAVTTSGSDVVNEHTFTSGVPSPGAESIHLDLYLFGNEKNPLQKDSEVVIEKFQYLP